MAAEKGTTVFPLLFFVIVGSGIRDKHLGPQHCFKNNSLKVGTSDNHKTPANLFSRYSTFLTFET
jgi:hypothetical protein